MPLKQIPIEVSARHVHLTEEDWATLFLMTTMTIAKPISQHGQFVAAERVVLRGPKGELKGVGVVGPFRPQTQVELAMTDARVLGIVAPLGDSGTLDAAATITIVGPKGEVVRAAAIVPRRHIHISPSEAMSAGVHDRQVVSVDVPGPRAVRLGNVLVRVHPDFTGRLHLDTDEGNASGVGAGMAATIVV